MQSPEDSNFIEKTMEKFDRNSEDFKRMLRLERLENSFYDLEKITDKWGFLRQIYMEILPWILEKAKKDVVSPINPYVINWGRYFSPIEEMAWHSIRHHYIALYPQFPLFNYFIDFANPYLRIGLELDGKEFHDPVKDKIRDELLYEFGWRIFRITGKECHAKFTSRDIIQERYFDERDSKWYNDEEITNWLMNTSDGVIYALRQVYFLKKEEDPLYVKCCDTLHQHRLADFPLLPEDDEYFQV